MPVIRGKKTNPGYKKLTTRCALDPVKMDVPGCNANGENTHSGSTL